MLLRHKEKLVLVRFIAEAKIGRRQSRFAPSQRKVSAAPPPGWAAKKTEQLK